MTFPLQVAWIAAAALIAAPALAQTSAPTPTTPMDSVPEKVAPGAKPTEPAQNLSQQLEQQNGVIQPKETDPKIEKPVPKTGDAIVAPPPPTPSPAAPK